MVDERTPKKDSAAIAPFWACPSVHISPNPAPTALLSAAEFGSAVRLFPYARRSGSNRNPPPRKEITSFSRASRNRLLWLVASLDRRKIQCALFITLTYPLGSERANDNKRHLDAFLKRARRKFKEAAILWKLEYTKKGTPHFHLLLFGAQFWHHRDVARAWAEIVNEEHEHHEKAGTQVQKLSQTKDAVRYVTKYLSKANPAPPSHRGRFWSLLGARAHLLSPVRLFEAGRRAHVQIRRVLDHLRQSKSRSVRRPRQAELGFTQRWFASFPSIARLADFLQMPEVPT